LLISRYQCFPMIWISGCFFLLHWLTTLSNLCLWTNYSEYSVDILTFPNLLSFVPYSNSTTLLSKTLFQGSSSNSTDWFFPSNSQFYSTAIHPASYPTKTAQYSKQTHNMILHHSRTLVYENTVFSSFLQWTQNYSCSVRIGRCSWE